MIKTCQYKHIEQDLKGLYALEGKISTEFGTYVFSVSAWASMGYTISDIEMEQIRRTEELSIKLNKLWQKVWDQIMPVINNVSQVNMDILKHNMSLTYQMGGHEVPVVGFQIPKYDISSHGSSKLFEREYQQKPKTRKDKSLTQRKYLEMTRGR